MSPADRAQVEQAKFNAEMAKREAGNIMTSARENSGLFTEQAEKTLSQGVATLGKTGNLGENVTDLSTVKTGIDVGSTETSEITGLKTQKATLEKQLSGSSKTDTLGRSSIEKELKTVNEQLGILGTTTTSDITSPEALKFASGSDLLTMVTTRDLMERDKRTSMRNAQTEAMTALKSGENYTKAASTYSDAGLWNTMTSILGTGAGIFSLGKTAKWW
jgi:hypothetical protein